MRDIDFGSYLELLERCRGCQGASSAPGRVHLTCNGRVSDPGRPSICGGDANPRQMGQGDASHVGKRYLVARADVARLIKHKRVRTAANVILSYNSVTYERARSDA